MIVGSLLLILVAVGLLVAGVLSGSNTLIVSCIAVVVLAAIVLVVGVRQSDDSGVPFDDDVDEPGEGGPTDEISASGADAFRVRQKGRHVSDESREALVPTAAGGGHPGRDADHAQMVGDERPGRPIPSQDRPGGRDGKHRDGPDFDGPDFDGPGFDAVAGSIKTAAHGLSIDGIASLDAPTTDVRTGADPAVVPVDREPAVTGDSTGDDVDPPDEPPAQVVSARSAAQVAALTTDVFVVDGRPRYHMAGCLHLLDRDTEPIAVNEAVELGFTPCSLCEPDSALLADARRV